MKRFLVFVVTLLMAGSLCFAQDTGDDKRARDGKHASKSKKEKTAPADSKKKEPPKSDRADASKKKPQTQTSDKPADAGKEPRTEASDKKPADKNTKKPRTEKPN